MKVPRTRDLVGQSPKLLEKLSVQDVTLGSLRPRLPTYQLLGPYDEDRRAGSLVQPREHLSLFDYSRTNLYTSAIGWVSIVTLISVLNEYMYFCCSGSVGLSESSLYPPCSTQPAQHIGDNSMLEYIPGSP